jgi:prepilin-type N-terminal cleavage/methylation domain-containing protein
VKHITCKLAFTLIELLVVLVIISLVAASVVLSSTGMWRQASMEATITRLESLDQHMRSYARSRGKSCELEFDTFEDHVRKVYKLNQRTDQPAIFLGRGFQLERIRMPGSSSIRRKQNVRFHANGTSLTYALGFRSVDNETQWLLFAGISGQLTRLNSERDLNAAFSLISP